MRTPPALRAALLVGCNCCHEPRAPQPVLPTPGGEPLPATPRARERGLGHVALPLLLSSPLEAGDRVLRSLFLQAVPWGVPAPPLPAVPGEVEAARRWDGEVQRGALRPPGEMRGAGDPAGLAGGTCPGPSHPWGCRGSAEDGSERGRVW